MAINFRIRKSRINLSAGLLLSGVVVGMPTPLLGQTLAAPVDAEVTYSRDIAPILQDNCLSCHRQGSIGPMSLGNYDEVRPWAGVIKLKVLRREMPPYHYDPHVGIQELKFDRRLSESEIQAIARWVDSGAPEGDPADLPPPPAWPDPSEWRLAAELGPPTHVVESPPFSLSADGREVWQRAMVETGLTEDRWIRAVEIKPSVRGRPVTHHATVFYVERDENGEWTRTETLSEYALGKRGEIVPEGAARLGPSSALLDWDIHYYPMGEEMDDLQVEIGFWLYPEGFEPRYRQVSSSYALQGDLVIPPHGTAMTQGMYSWDHPVRIDSFQAHGHTRLRGKMLELFDPKTGNREILSLTPNFDPGWNISYMYEEHAAPLVPPGQVIVLTAWYDNTANNPNNPDPEVWVTRGSRTVDEMSHGWLAVTHLDDEGYQELLANRQSREEGDKAAGND